MLTVSWPKCTVRYRAVVVCACVLCSTTICLGIATEGPVYGDGRLGDLGVRVGLGGKEAGELGGGHSMSNSRASFSRHSTQDDESCLWTLTLGTTLTPTLRSTCHMQVHGHVHFDLNFLRGPHIPSTHPPIHPSTPTLPHPSAFPSIGHLKLSGPSQQPWPSRSLVETKPLAHTYIGGTVMYVDLCTHYRPGLQPANSLPAHRLIRPLYPDGPRPRQAGPALALCPGCPDLTLTLGASH